MNAVHNLVLLASSLAPLPSQTAQDLLVHVRAKPEQQVCLLFAAGRGPALKVAGLHGVLRLDLASLIVLQGAAPNQLERSVTRIPGGKAIPREVLHCQALVAGPSGMHLSRVFQPLVDEDVDALELTLVLGNAGPEGRYLFGLSEQQILSTASHYSNGPVNGPKLLAAMSRPYRRAMDPVLADQVGLDGALRVLNLMWTRMLQRVPLATLMAEVRHEQDELSGNLLDAKYPNGIAEDDEHWDFCVDQSTPSMSSSTAPDVIVSSGNRRLRLQTTLTDSGMSGSFGLAHGVGYALSYKKVLGIWWRTKADSLKVSGTLETDLQTNTFSNTDYSVSSVIDSVYAWFTSSRGRVDTSARLIEGSTTITASGSDT